MTYHDCENYHDCHVLQIFGTNKQAVVYTILSNTWHCTILMVASWCYGVTALITNIIRKLLCKDIYNYSTNVNHITKSRILDLDGGKHHNCSCNHKNLAL